MSEHLVVPQASALNLVGSSLLPLVDETDNSFQVRHLSEASDASSVGMKRLQDSLNFRDSPALVYELKDVYLQTTHWVASIDGSMVAETRYLIHDKHLSRNFGMIQPAQSETLDPQRIWILGMNYAPGNYWHWHAQSLPAILHAVETVSPHDFHKISIVTGLLANWQRDGLGAIGFRPEQVEEVPRGTTIHVDRLLYSDLLSSRQVFSKNRIRSRTAEVLRHAARSTQIQPVRRLFISRADSSRRPVVNEDELSGQLEKIGFVSVSNTRLSLLEQVHLYESADVVVAAHGAGSTNLFFMRNGTSFVEFQQASHVNAGPLSLGKSSGVTPYAAVFADDGRGQATEGWSIDVRIAETLVRDALNEN